MLTIIEKFLFVLVAAGSAYFTWSGIQRIMGILQRGHGKPDLTLARKRLFSALFKAGALLPTFKIRPAATILHAMVAWGFIYYLLVP